MSLDNSKRQCPYCGATISRSLTDCPVCHEHIPAIAETRMAPVTKPWQIRRGLLYILLAGVIQYFAGGYSGLHLPFSINPLITNYLAPILLMSGLGLFLYGLYLRRRIRLVVTH